MANFPTPITEQISWDFNYWTRNAWPDTMLATTAHNQPMHCDYEQGAIHGTTHVSPDSSSAYTDQSTGYMNQSPGYTGQSPASFTTSSDFVEPLQLDVQPAPYSTVIGRTVRADTKHQTPNRSKRMPRVEGGYECKYCSNESFDLNSDLNRHIRTTHFKEHGCSLCDKSFAYMKDVRRHEYSKHKEFLQASRRDFIAPNYLCPVSTCDRHFKGYSRRDNLQRHIRTIHH